MKTVCESNLKGCAFSPPQDGATPLSRASHEGHVEIVRKLLDSGARHMSNKVKPQFYSVIKICNFELELVRELTTSLSCHWKERHCVVWLGPPH